MVLLSFHGILCEGKGNVGCEEPSPVFRSRSSLSWPLSTEVVICPNLISLLQSPLLISLLPSTFWFDSLFSDRRKPTRKSHMALGLPALPGFLAAPSFPAASNQPTPLPCSSFPWHHMASCYPCFWWWQQAARHRGMLLLLEACILG